MPETPGRTPSRGWALLGYLRPDGFEQTLQTYGCTECGAVVWDRERHEEVCLTASARTQPAARAGSDA